MTRLILSLILLLPQLVSAENGIRWLEEVHNFGAFHEEMGRVSCRMRFVNETASPVVINQVHVTCGCTTPEYSREPVEPGDTGSVILTYDPTGRPGRFEKKIYVDLNTVPSRYTLYIKGTVLGQPATISARFPTEAGPLRLRTPSLPFGEVTKGKSKSYFFEVYNASADTLSPQWINLPPYITVGTTNSQLAPGEDMAFTFRLSTDELNDYGLTVDSLQLSPNGNTDELYYIPMMVMLQEDFSKLSPQQRRDAPVLNLNQPSLDFGTLVRNEGPVTLELTVSNRGKDSLIIRRAYSYDPGLTVDVESNKIKKGKTGIIRVTVNPAEITDDILNARVMLITNDPGNPMLPVRIVGLIK